MTHLKRLLFFTLRASFRGLGEGGRCGRRLMAVLGGPELAQAVGNGRELWWERVEVAIGMESEDSESWPHTKYLEKHGPT